MTTHYEGIELPFAAKAEALRVLSDSSQQQLHMGKDGILTVVHTHLSAVHSLEVGSRPWAEQRVRHLTAFFAGDATVNEIRNNSSRG